MEPNESAIALETCRHLQDSERKDKRAYISSVSACAKRCWLLLHVWGKIMSLHEVTVGEETPSFECEHLFIGSRRSRVLWDLTWTSVGFRQWDIGRLLETLVTYLETAPPVTEDGADYGTHACAVQETRHKHKERGENKANVNYKLEAGACRRMALLTGLTPPRSES